MSGLRALCLQLNCHFVGHNVLEQISKKSFIVRIMMVSILLQQHWIGIQNDDRTLHKYFSFDSIESIDFDWMNVLVFETSVFQSQSRFIGCIEFERIGYCWFCTDWFSRFTKFETNICWWLANRWSKFHVRFLRSNKNEKFNFRIKLHRVQTISMI